MQINLGFALLLTTLAGLSTGIGSTIAYFIRRPNYSHMAVMMSFCAGTMLYISFAAGLTEPVGALIGYAILLPFLTPALLSTLLAFVAGIMIYISLDELLPLAHRYGQEHQVIIGIGAGMLVMTTTLFLSGTLVSKM